MESRALLCLVLGTPDVTLLGTISAAGWDVHTVADLSAARRAVLLESYMVGLVVIESIDERCIAEIDEFLALNSRLEWVGIFSRACLDATVCGELILNHFFDFHTMPAFPDRLIHTLGHAYGRARLCARTVNSHSADPQDHPIVGNSPGIRKLLRQVKKVARVDAPVMIGGASGSGKELAAQVVHRSSGRAKGPFVAVNCGALPAALIQTELFGYEKGAFTGAVSAKQGLIEAASGGTIFLDEIGDLPLDQQTNLLRFLQEKTINRVGSTKSIRVDVRVIAASHVNLELAVASGRFREDLYYRLNVLPLTVPPLCERAQDIVPLAQHFFALYAKEGNPRIRGFSSSALCMLQNHGWPGNVRELLNRVRRALIMAEGRLITPQDLGFTRVNAVLDQAILQDVRAGAEKNAIQGSLRRAGNNISLAARELGVSRMTLYRLLEKHELNNG